MLVRVLLVDDDSSILEVSEDIMLHMNSNLEFGNACCVAEAFKKLATGNYDIVVSDYEMPQKNGLEFLKELKQQKNEIPFILFTGKGREEVAIKALNLGADGYFNKQGSTETVYGELSHAIFSLVEKKKTKEALSQSELRWTTTLTSIGDAVIATDTCGKVTFMNAEAEKLTGWNSRQALQQPVKKVFNIINEQTRVDVDDLVGLVLKKKIIIKLIARTLLVRKDGSEVAIDDSAAPIRDKEGNTTGAVLVFRDITQNRKAEDELFRSEEKYRGLFDSNQDGIIVSDAKGIVVSVNQAAALMLGYKKVMELVDLPVCTLYANPSDNQVLHELLAEKGDTKDFETELKRKNGSIFDANVTITVRNDAQGNLLRLESIFRDISERKKADLVVFEAREYAQNILATMRESLLVLDDNLRVISANDSFYKTFGVTSKEIEGKCIFDLGNSQWDIPKLHELLEKIIPEKSFFADFEVEHVFPKIGPKVMLLNARQIHQRLKGVNLILVAFEDISERKKADLVVFEAREYAQNILATMRESLLVLDDNLKVISANDSFYKTFGVTSKETEGKCIFDLGNSQWDIPKLHELLEKIIPEKSFFADFEVEHVFPKIGPKIMLLNARQIHQRLKGVNLILVAFEDITERKKAEEKIQESRDRMDRINEKLQVVGHLTRHDALNKIAVIDGQTFLLNEKYADHMETANRLGKIQQACSVIKTIFGFAKIYEQIGMGELTYIDVEEKLNEAIALFPGSILKMINECRGLTVLADSSLMQLFYNLVDNTIKHGKKATTIRVHYEKVDQAHLKLVYEDDGVGVPLEDKPKLFTEGFSTSDSTGFGLFLTKKMIQVYGWTITEEGEPGKGAKFVITIPSSSVSILKQKSHLK